MCFILHTVGHQINIHRLHLSIGVTTIGAKIKSHVATSLRLKHLFSYLEGNKLHNRIHEDPAAVTQEAISTMHLPLQASHLAVTTLGAP